MSYIDTVTFREISQLQMKGNINRYRIVFQLEITQFAFVVSKCSSAFGDSSTPGGELKS